MSATMFLGRVPPHSLEAERGVLGACLLWPEAIDDVAELLVPTDFYLEAHELVFSEILALHHQRSPVDLVTLTDALRTHGHLDRVGGVAFLSSLLDCAPFVGRAAAWAEVIRSKARLRSAISVCIGTVERAYGDLEEPVDEFLSGFLATAEKAVGDRERSNIRSVGEALPETMKAMDADAAKTSEITGVPTGFPGIDRLTSGLQPGDLIVVGGRPSMGKTALGLDILDHAAQHGHPGLLFSLEMRLDQLNRRLLASRSGVEGTKLRFPKTMLKQDYDKMLAAAGELYRLPLYVDDSADASVFDIRVRARRAVRKLGIKILGIDYLQLLRIVSAKKYETREQEIALITRSLKNLARELGIPVLLLCQLNRGPEGRPDKRPLLSDLRESGAIEQDADLILFVYRESMYTMNAADNSAEVLARKNRNGPIGTIAMQFDRELTRFRQHTTEEPFGPETKTPPDDAWKWKGNQKEEEDVF